MISSISNGSGVTSIWGASTGENDEVKLVIGSYCFCMYIKYKRRQAVENVCLVVKLAEMSVLQLYRANLIKLSD